MIREPSPSRASGGPRLVPVILLLGARCAGPEPAPEESPPPEDSVQAAAPVAEVTVEVDASVQTVLRVGWHQERAVESGVLVYGVAGEPTMRTPARGLAEGDQEQVLLGLPPETEVVFHFEQEDGGHALESEDHTATTGVLPADLPLPALLHADPELVALEAPFLLGSVDAGGWYRGPCWVVILDRAARVVWYHEVPGQRLCLFAQVATDGHHLVLEGTTHYLYGTELEPIVERLTLAGGVQETVTLPDLGFTFDEIEGGAILYAAEREGFRLIRREPDGSEAELWDCGTWMLAQGGSLGWCSPNSVVWNPAQGTAFWSMFQADTVVEIELATGALVRQLGQLSGGWAFDPPESVVDFQHYPGFTAAGTILTSTHCLADPGVQYAREWRVDEENQTLVEVWSYGPEVLPYAAYGGEAWRMAGGSTFITYGTAGRVRQITPDGRTAWEITWPTEPNSLLVGHFSALHDLYAIAGAP
ncbi:MAG: hypothetical protein ABIO70_05070 [Pseudomonadota bacterium]